MYVIELNKDDLKKKLKHFDGQSERTLTISFQKISLDQ